MRTRASHVARTEVAVHAAARALAAVDLEVVEPGGAAVAVALDGKVHEMRVEPVAYCTGPRARELVARYARPRFVVCEKMTSEGRSVLSDAGWSWLDRRGRVHVRVPGVLVDIEVPSDPQLEAPSSPDEPITGRSGLTVAYWLCRHPGESLSPTRSAQVLALAPSTISTATRRLADAGLLDDTSAGVFPELFWELAAAWRPQRTWLLTAPNPERHLSPDPAGPGWRRTGTPAAVAYGAPVVSTIGEPVELYVVSPVEISIAVRECGAASPGKGAASIMVPPVAAVSSVDPGLSCLGGWTIAPRLAVALDLAQDRARGREILEGWEPPDAVWR